MIKTTFRTVRAAGLALAIAALSITGLTTAPATAQDAMPGMPNMGDPYPLTADLVIAWVESYPDVVALSESLEDEFDVPEGEDPMAGLAALGMATEAMNQLNGAVTPYGFTDFQQWTDVMFSVVFSYSILEAPAEQRDMLLGMFNQPQANLDAVEVHMDAVAALVDSL